MTSLSFDQPNPTAWLLKPFDEARAFIAKRPCKMLLLSLTLLSALFLLFPSLDLAVSRLFADAGQGFALQDDAQLQFVRSIGKFSVVAALTVCFAGLVVAVLGRRTALLPQAHEALYVISVFALAPGLIVNGIFKEFFGRARPYEILEFGGALPFTPVWTVSGGCIGNCSFVSGEGASAAALLAFVAIVQRRDRPAAFLAIALVALLLSVNRIAFGGHFVSDVVLSWCITGFVILALRPVFLTYADAINTGFARAGARLTGRPSASDVRGSPAAAKAPVAQAVSGRPRRFSLVSVVVPARNEAANLNILVREIGTALAHRPFEVLVVDDGSTDTTADTLARLRADGLPVRHLRHETSCGQSRAVRTGVFAAKGDVVATIDGDNQNDPAYIPVLVAALESAGASAGLAAGQRLKRTDTKLKQISSRFANGLRTAILKDSTRDTGCGLKAMPTDLFRRLPFFDGWHRYLPALVLREGFAVVHRDVVDRQRRFGQSNYGIFDRAARGALDLFGVWWLRRRGRKVPTVCERTLDAQ